MKRSRRLNQNDPLSGRPADDASRYREQAGELPPGEERDALLRKARELDTAAHINDWINSPGLRPPE